MGQIKTGEGFKATAAQQVVLDLTNDQETNVALVQAAIEAAVLEAAGGAASVDTLNRELEDRKGLESEVAGLRAEFETAAAKKVEEATADLKAENEKLKERNDGVMRLEIQGAVDRAVADKDQQIAALREEVKSLAASREALKDEVRAELAAKSLSPEAAKAAVGLPADPGGGKTEPRRRR